jgi:hypothetical protein
VGYQSTTQGNTSNQALNPFVNAAGPVFNAGNLNDPIVTGVNPTTQQPGGWQVPTGAGTTQGTQASLTEQLAQMPKSQLEALQNKLISTGLFPSVRVTGIADNATLSAYNTVLSYSLLYQFANPDKTTSFTPDDVLNQLVNTKPKDKNQTSTSVNLTNKVQAEQSLITAFSNKLGRRPTDSEVANFVGALHAYETNNPDVTTQTVAGDGSGTVKNVTQNNKGTSSLYFSNDFANQFAVADPSVQAEYQAGQHLDFYNLALQALTQGPVSTGNTD